MHIEQVHKLWKIKTAFSLATLNIVFIIESLWYHNDSYLLLFGKKKLQTFEML